MTLSVRDKEIVETLYPPMREAVKAFLLEAQPLNAFIFCGYRSISKQYEEWIKGRNSAGEIIDFNEVTTYSRPGYSWHNYGLAFDVAFGGTGKWSWSEAGSAEWEKLGDLGEKHNFHWGGRWGRRADSPHFERNAGHRIEELQYLYSRQQQLSDVWVWLNSGQSFQGEEQCLAT